MTKNSVLTTNQTIACSGFSARRVWLTTAVFLFAVGGGVVGAAPAGAEIFNADNEDVIVELSVLDGLSVGVVSDTGVVAPPAIVLSKPRDFNAIEPASGAVAVSPPPATTVPDVVISETVQQDVPPANADIQYLILDNPPPTPPMPDLSGLQNAPEPVSATPKAAPQAAPNTASVPALRPIDEVTAEVSGQSDGRSSSPSVPNVKTVYYDSAPSKPVPNVTNALRQADAKDDPSSRIILVERDTGAGETEALVVSARRALQLGLNESALEMYDTLYKAKPHDVRILMGRAVAQQNVGYRELAIQSYEAVLAADPRNTEAMINMMGLLQQEYPSVALRRLLDLREKNPANAGLVAQIGMTYATMGQNAEAIRALSTAISLNPQEATHQYNLAILFDRAGDKANAIRYYEQALEVDAVHGGGRSIPREQVYDRLSNLRS